MESWLDPSVLAHSLQVLNGAGGVLELAVQHMSDLRKVVD